MNTPMDQDYADARRMYKDVIHFHGMMGFYPSISIDDVPGGKEAIDDKRIKIMSEERDELIEAIRAGDKAAILHEGIDRIYVVLGAMHEAGITEAEFSIGWGLVQSANMTKDAPPSPLDKALKGKDFKRADCTLALGAEAEEHRYGIVIGAGKQAKVTFVSTKGPMDKTGFVHACEHAYSSAGSLPTCVVELA